MSIDPYETYKVGDSTEVVHTVTTEDVEAFAKLTGDNNPLHMDDDYAARTSFQKRVVHGMLTASFISTIIGMRIPGPGSLWVEQHLRFLAPVRIGEKIRAVGTVKRKSPSQRILVIETVVFGDDDRRVIDGEATVKVLEVRKDEDEGKDMSEVKNAVIVTGGSRGIGAAIAKDIAAMGFPVVIGYSASADDAQAVVDAICSDDGRAIHVQADMSDPAAVQTLAQRALDEYGAVAGVVNNASPSIEFKDIGEVTWADVQRHMEVQVQGALSLSQALLPHFVENGGGNIVNITTAALEGMPPAKMGAYLMGKAALTALTKSLAQEYGPKGVRVNAVAPGMTETVMISDFPDKAKMVEKMQTPLRRLATPGDVSGVVAFLFSDGARHMTGQTLNVCGGAAMS